VVRLLVQPTVRLKKILQEMSGEYGIPVGVGPTKRCQAGGPTSQAALITNAWSTADWQVYLRLYLQKE
jgi:hypothetical protein